jgi:hypothetical protein
MQIPELKSRAQFYLLKYWKINVGKKASVLVGFLVWFLYQRFICATISNRSLQ